MIASFLIMRGVSLFLDYPYELTIFYEKHHYGIIDYVSNKSNLKFLID